jgi:hypothetical protein
MPELISCTDINEAVVKNAPMRVFLFYNFRNSFFTLFWNPADSGLEPGQVKKKIEKEKTWCNPVDLARLDQKPGCNLLIFIFFY